MTDRVMGDTPEATAAESAHAEVCPKIQPRSASACPRPLLTLDDLEREVVAVRDAIAPGAPGLHVTGQWSAGQILHHLTRTITSSLDGFSHAHACTIGDTLPFRDTPVLGRVLRRIDRQDAEAHRLVLRRQLLVEPLVAGGPSIALAGQVAPFAQVWTNDAAAWLLVVIARLRAGARMTHPSPTIGPLSHEEWLAFHLRHAAWHLSFVRLGSYV